MATIRGKYCYNRVGFNGPRLRPEVAVKELVKSFEAFYWVGELAGVYIVALDKICDFFLAINSIHSPAIPF